MITSSCLTGATTTQETSTMTSPTVTESQPPQTTEEASTTIATVGQSTAASETVVTPQAQQGNEGREETVADGAPQEATEAPGGGDKEGQMTTRAKIGVGNSTGDSMPSDQNTTNPTTTRRNDPRGSSTTKGSTTPLQPV